MRPGVNTQRMNMPCRTDALTAKKSQRVSNDSHGSVPASATNRCTHTVSLLSVDRARTYIWKPLLELPVVYTLLGLFTCFLHSPCTAAQPVFQPQQQPRSQTACWVQLAWYLPCTAPAQQHRLCLNPINSLSPIYGNQLGGRPARTGPDISLMVQMSVMPSQCQAWLKPAKADSLLCQFTCFQHF